MKVLFLRILSILLLVAMIVSFAPLTNCVFLRIWEVNEPSFTIFIWSYALLMMLYTIYMVGSYRTKDSIRFSAEVLKRRVFTLIFCEMFVFMVSYVWFYLNSPGRGLPFGLSSPAILFIYKAYLVIEVLMLILAILKPVIIKIKTQHLIKKIQEENHEN